MKKIYVATKSRGFLLDLFNSNFDKIKFSFEQKKMYETNSKRKLLLSKLVKSKLADHLGIIQRINIQSEVNLFSYNRFLKTNQPYVIYLENPLALVHYSTNRNSTLLGKRKVNKLLSDPNLKTIVCLSKACFETLEKFYNIPEKVRIEQIYPLVYSNKLTSNKSIIAKCNNENIYSMYISSNFYLKGGEEILATFTKLEKSGILNIKLIIVTKIADLNFDTISRINKNSNIELYDFNLTKEDLNVLYNQSCIYLNPTRQDSFSLVSLEAMKSGNVILTTDLYALPEMVLEGYNGYLTQPRYRFFDYNNLPNKEVWNNRKNTIYSDYLDENIVEFLFEKLKFLNSHRNELEKMSTNSFLRASTGEFDEKFIKSKWETVVLKA